MADISKIALPNGNTYNLKDKTLSDALLPLASGPIEYVKVESLSSGQNYQEGCAYTKIGTLVFVYVRVAFTSSPTNASVFTLPDGYRPKQQVNFYISGGGSYIASGHGVIESNGIVKVSSPDKWAFGNAMFFSTS